MAEWKIIVGKEKRSVINVKTKETRKTEYYQIIAHDGMSFSVGDYEIVDYNSLRITSKGELPSNALEIDGVYYEERGDKRYMSDFNDIVNVYIRYWKIAKPKYDITTTKLAVEYFKELIELKNQLLMLK